MLQGHDDREYTSLFVLHTMPNKLLEHETSLGNKATLSQSQLI